MRVRVKSAPMLFRNKRALTESISAAAGHDRISSRRSRVVISGECVFQITFGVLAHVFNNHLTNDDAKYYTVVQQ